MTDSMIAETVQAGWSLPGLRDDCFLEMTNKDTTDVL
jgi:hypothetical protein